MAAFGGGAPWPRRHGGGGVGVPRKTRLLMLVDSINASFGTAYDNSQPSLNYPRQMAIARALDGLWSSNARLSNQWQPTRLTDFLPRWEAILGIYPASDATLRARRAACAFVLSRVGKVPTYSYMSDTIRSAMPTNMFVGILHTTAAQALVYTPASPAWTTTPASLVDAFGVRNFFSTVANIMVQVAQPSGMADGAFYDYAGAVLPLLDSILPAWCTADWYRNGPSGLGFFLDDEHNLDNEIFDV